VDGEVEERRWVGRGGGEKVGEGDVAREVEKGGEEGGSVGTRRRRIEVRKSRLATEIEKPTS